MIFVVLNFTVLRAEQSSKALLPTDDTFAGIVIVVKAVHPPNALDPIVVTLLGIVMPVKAVQP